MCSKCIININCVRLKYFFLIMSEVFLRNPEKIRTFMDLMEIQAIYSSNRLHETVTFGIHNIWQLLCQCL